MRYVDRNSVAPPKIFASVLAREARAMVLEALSGSALKVRQSRSSSSSDRYSVAADDNVREALVALFDSCCAFCERKMIHPLVHQFRPTAHAEPVEDTSTSHLYYSWLAEAWQNLYPICEDCVPRRRNHFPVARNRRCALPKPSLLMRFADSEDGRWPAYPPDEKPILLDPCLDEKLSLHLQFLVTGQAVGRTKRGRETIDHFGLNRPQLASDRKKVFNDNIGYTHQEIRGEERNRMPWMSGIEGFTGATRLFLRDALAQALGQRPTNNIGLHIARLRRMDDGVERFHRAIEALRSQHEAGAVAEPVQLDEPSSIVSVSIRNFKSLERIDLALPMRVEETASDSIASSLLILGENATGKSTILEAIALAVMSPQVRARVGFDPAQSILNPRYMGAAGGYAPPEAEITVRFELGSRTLTLTRGPDGAGGVRDDGVVPRIPLFAYGAFRQYLTGERKFAPHKHVRSLFKADEVLSNPDKWLSGLRDSEFDMVVRAIREVFNVEASFEVLERTDNGIVVVAKLDVRPDAPLQRTPLSIVSSGFRAVLAMLCDIMQGLMDSRINPGFQSLETARGLVLIDEVEAHLHPRWKMSIMTGLRRALPQMHFIATSHDPLCLRGMGQFEVMVLQRIAGSEADTDLPVFTQTLTNLPDNQKWTIEQLLTADFFQLRTTESNDAERRAARMQDLLASGVSPDDDAELQTFLAEFSESLPIGHTDVHRLVQEAIAEYLSRRRDASDEKLRQLRSDARQSILNALEKAG